MDCLPEYEEYDYGNMTQSMYDAIMSGTYDEDTNYLDDLEIPDDWDPGNY